MLFLVIITSLNAFMKPEGRSDQYRVSIIDTYLK